MEASGGVVGASRMYRGCCVLWCGVVGYGVVWCRVVLLLCGVVWGGVGRVWRVWCGHTLHRSVYVHGRRKLDLCWKTCWDHGVLSIVGCLAAGAPFGVQIRSMLESMLGPWCIKYTFVGYYESIREWTLGVSETRRLWVHKKALDLSRGERIRVRELREALGRFGFVAGPLRNIRPFLGPLYAWAGALPPGAKASLPLFCRISARVLSEVAKTSVGIDCSRQPIQRGELFRTDAKAEPGLVAVGGWETGAKADPGKARWFAVTFRAETCPSHWSFLFDLNPPSRAIAAWELLGILMAVILFDVRGKGGTRATATCATDNQSISLMAIKGLTTKPMIAAVWSELSLQLEARGINLDLSWVRRDLNQEADADMCRRIAEASGITLAVLYGCLKQARKHGSRKGNLEGLRRRLGSLPEPRKQVAATWTSLGTPW